MINQSVKSKNTKDICDELLPKVSRSFALAIQALPEPARSYVCVSYLLCRMVDTIEDHPTLANKDQCFSLFDQCLIEIEHWQKIDISLLKALNPPQSWDHELMLESDSVFASLQNFSPSIRNIITQNVLEMSFGMRGYTARSNQGSITLLTDEDLDRYCFYVAGTVGNLLTDIFAHEAKITDSNWIHRQKERGYHFALGLQKVNMIKDVVSDFKRGSVFVPQEWLKLFNIESKDLIEGEGNDKVKALLLHFTRQAVYHLVQARDYITELPVKPEGFRLFCIWPYALALDTLQLGLRKDQLFTEEHEIKVNRADMYRMMALTKKVASHDMPLKLYFNRKIHLLREAVN